MEASQRKIAIYALYAMRFLTSSGFGVSGVVVPLFMRDSGVSYVGLGIAFSAFGIVMGIAGMFFGAHSDKVGRKPYLVLSLVLSSAINFFYTQARGLSDFVALQALRGVSSSLNGIIVPALMTDLTIDSERGRKFGRLGGFRWVGTGMGYFLGGVLSQILGYGSSFIFVSIMILASCFLVLALVPSYRLPSEERFSFTTVRGISHNLKIWLLISLVTAFAIGPVEVMVIPSYVVEPGPLGIDKILFGTFMSASYILVSSTQFIGGNLADRFSRRKLASFFFLLSAPFIAAQPLSPVFAYFAFMYALEGIGEGLSNPCRDAILASSIRPKHRGFEFSIVGFFANVGSVAGFLVMGHVLEILGFFIPFLVRALVYALVAVIIYFKLTD